MSDNFINELIIPIFEVMPDCVINAFYILTCSGIFFFLRSLMRGDGHA